MNFCSIHFLVPIFALPAFIPPIIILISFCSGINFLHLRCKHHFLLLALLRVSLLITLGGP